MYYHPVYVNGNPEGMRTSTVKSIISARAEYPIVMDNGDVLPKHHYVKPTRVIGNNGELTDHKGLNRMILKFRMKKSRDASFREDNAMGPALAAPPKRRGQRDAEGSVWPGGLRRSTRAKKNLLNCSCEEQLC